MLGLTGAGPGSPQVTVSRETLGNLADRYGLDLDAVGRLEAIVDALDAEPNPPTAIRGEAVANLHVADSLSGLEVDALRTASQIADIGSGAGFPGLVLAAVLPHARLDLVEANRRKAAVIERIASAAALRNVRTRAVRAEELASGAGNSAYQAVTARALATLPVLVEYAAPLLAIGGALVAWKGAPDTAETEAGARAAEALGMSSEAVLQVVPFLGSERRMLYLYSKVRETPGGYPRRPGAAVKRPLGL